MAQSTIRPRAGRSGFGRSVAGQQEDGFVLPEHVEIVQGVVPEIPDTAHTLSPALSDGSHGLLLVLWNRYIKPRLPIGGKFLLNIFVNSLLAGRLADER